MKISEAGLLTGSSHWEWTQVLSKADTWVLSPPSWKPLLCWPPFPWGTCSSFFCSTTIWTLLFSFHIYSREKTCLLLALTSLATATALFCKETVALMTGSGAGAQVSVYTRVSLNSSTTLGFEHFPSHMYQVGSKVSFTMNVIAFIEKKEMQILHGQ